MMLLVFLLAAQDSNYVAVPQHNFYYQSMMGENNRSDFSYEVRDDCIYVLYKGKIMSVLSNQKGKNPTLSRDTISTIWLPDSLGGVVKPDMFLYNPNNDAVYITGQEQQNIAVCDAQTGERIYGVLTGRGAMGLACSETLNKIYYASYSNNTIEIIDGVSNSIIKTIQLQGEPADIIWNSITDEIYYPDRDNDIMGVIDCNSDTVIANIQIGGRPHVWSMLFNAVSNKIYCPCHCAPYIDSIVIIDGNSHSIINKTPAGGFPYDPVVNTVDNKIYYVNRFDENLTIIDGLGDSLITIMTVGSDPWALAYNPVMNRVYVGHVGSNDIYVLNGSTNQLITIIPVGEGAESIVYDSLDNRIFVGSVMGRVIVIDCSTNGIVGYLPTGYWTWNMFWDNTYNQVWVGNPGGSSWPTYTVLGYSGDSLQPVLKAITGFTPYASILNASTNKFYSVGHDDKYLIILDMNSPTSSVMKEIGEGPWDVIDNSLENKIYCANRWSGIVTIIDGITDSIIAEVATDSQPVALAFNRTDNKIYVNNLCSASLTVIEGNTNNVLTTIPVGNRPIPVLWNPTDNKIYTGNSVDNTITIIDAHVDTVITTIPAGDYMWSLIHNSADDKIYSANFWSDDITVIDGVSNQVITTLNMGNEARPYTFAYSSVSNKVYCANILGYNIAVIDGASDSVITSIPIPDNGGPYSLLYNPITNTIFCAYVDNSDYPWQDAIAVIDAESDSILSYFTIDSQRWYFGLGCPKKALVFDSLTNVVYFAHYTSGKISVIDGTTGIDEMTFITPTKFSLRIVPNPFRDKVNIIFQIADFRFQNDNFSLRIYDVSGRLVKDFRLKSEIHNLQSTVSWNGTDDSNRKLSNGVYFLKFQAGDYQETKKLLLIK